MSITYLPLFVIIGVALDWAFFEKMRTIIGMFRPEADAISYRHDLWPRIAVTIAACLVVGAGLMPKEPDDSLIIIGGATFLASNFYVDYKLWRQRQPK